MTYSVTISRNIKYLAMMNKTVQYCCSNSRIS